MSRDVQNQKAGATSAGLLRSGSFPMDSIRRQARQRPPDPNVVTAVGCQCCDSIGRDQREEFSMSRTRTRHSTEAAAIPATPPSLIFVGSDKGGIGKSFVSALAADLLDVAGIVPRIVQIDDQERLPTLYPERVTTVSLASMDDVRRDPGAIVAAFDPFYAAIERTIADRVPTIVDIGGPQQTAVEEYCGLVDLDADLADAGLNAVWLVPATAEPEAMRGAVRTEGAIARVLPFVRRALVLNERDGGFRFYPGSPADRIWSSELKPVIEAITTARLPAIAPGSWAPFEAAGKRFVDVVAAEIPEIQRWTGRSRPAAKVLRGDVAFFLSAAQDALGDLIGLDRGDTDAE
jgi:Mrp family chromosome partitioning ATPase